MAWPVLLWWAALEAQALGLSADDYLAREQAQAALQAAYPLSAPLLARLRDDRRADPEARRRAAIILDRAGHGLSAVDRAWGRLLMGLCRQGYPAWPWIDSLPESWPERSTIIMAKLEEARGRGDVACGPPDYSEFRAATALYARYLLEAGLPEHCLRGLLHRMVDGDRKQCETSPTLRWAGVPPLRGPQPR